MTKSDESFMTVEEARRISAPLYEALNKPSEKNVSELLAQACNDDYHPYHTNQEFLTRDQLADVFKAMGETVPDLAWEVVDIHVVDDTMIVRGEATGTPVKEFWGAAPTGKSFRTMAIDVFTVRDGRLAKGYHIENWATAIQQLNA
ncbi:ester cyclase [Streptomyces sp. NBC_01450]|uniref:ester cyclase n=1 Tax=Streptomyces sp. NBC_01450 TaxID=2903871 RepID=UPI002E2EA6AF|nr:ester cyclase [Streptomyces sp. NBC_01450]